MYEDLTTEELDDGREAQLAYLRGADQDPTKEQEINRRADRARKALAAAYDQDEPLQDNIVDLITDLLHLATLMKHKEAVEMRKGRGRVAQQHFEEER